VSTTEIPRAVSAALAGSIAAASTALHARRRLLLVAALSVTCLAAAPAAAHAELVVNGGFETGLDQWTQVPNGVDLVPTTFFVSHSGTYSVDLNSSAPGGVAQNLTTVAGQQYTLSFWMAGNPDPNKQYCWVSPTDPSWMLYKLSVRWAGRVVANATFDNTHGVYTAGHMGWTRHTFTVTAPAGSATSLEFDSVAPTGACGPTIDDVSVAPARSATGHLYWSKDAAAGIIGRANLNGTSPNQTFVTGGSSVRGVAVDHSYVYWANYGLNAIGRANLNGTSPNQSFITAPNASAVAVDGSYVYWANTTAGTIGRANLNGTSPNQSFITGASNTTGVAVDGSHVYWSDFIGGVYSIGRANLDGTNPNQSFITGGNITHGVAVDGSYLYWTNDGLGSIGRADLNGTNPNQTFITGITYPRGIAVDHSYVYWTNYGLNAIGRANLNGTSPNQSFMTNVSLPYGVAVGW
jgi:hypothetical protein